MRVLIKYIIVFISINLNVIGQNSVAINEFKKVINEYKNNPFMSFNVEVYAYETVNDKTAELVGKGFGKKTPDKYHSKFQENEVIVNGNSSLMIDHDRKSIDYYDVSINNKKAKKAQGFNISMDSLLKASDSLISYQGLKDGRKMFTMKSNSGPIKQTDLFVDPQTNFITKTIYYYAASTEDYEMGVYCVVIYYKNISTAKIQDDSFLFNKYVKQQGKSFVGLNTLKNYKVNYYKY